jgi:hypothetical protein
MWRLIRSFFRLLKNDSATALSQQFPPATHAGHELVVFAPQIEVITAKLAALVRVNHHRGFGPSAPYRHHHGIEYQFRGHGGVH